MNTFSTVVLGYLSIVFSDVYYINNIIYRDIFIFCELFWYDIVMTCFSQNFIGNDTYDSLFSLRDVHRLQYWYFEVIKSHLVVTNYHAFIYRDNLSYCNKMLCNSRGRGYTSYPVSQLLCQQSACLKHQCW